MQFTDIFIRRPVLASVVSLLILVLGLRAYAVLPILQFPRTENALVTVTTIYYGADPDVVAGFITTPLENAIAQANGIDYMNSVSQSSVSTITVTLRLNYDADKALTEINTKVASVLNQLPPGTLQPTLTVKIGQTIDAMYIGFNSDTLAPNQITDYLTRVVQPKLQAVPGVQTAELLGQKVFALRAWLDPQKLAAFGLTATDVSQALTANDYISGIGNTKGQMVQVNLSASTSLHSAEEFRNLVIKQSGGAIVRLKDVANVTLGAEDYESEVGFDGKQAVYIGILVAPSANLLEVIAGIHKVFPEIQALLPHGLNGEIIYDSTEFVHSAINEVIRSLAEALIIVTLVVFIFLGSMRASIIPTVAIPLSLIGTLIILLALGYSINLLTLLALVLAIGLVVDDAIIVVENVSRHLEEGMAPMDAAIAGGARARRPDHRHDRGAGRGLCADRLPERAYRRAVCRVRLRAGRRRHHIGHRRADLVADAVLAAAQSARSRARRLGVAADAVHRPAVSPAARVLRTVAARQLEYAAGDAGVRRYRALQHLFPVRQRQNRAGADRGPGRHHHPIGRGAQRHLAAAPDVFAPSLQDLRLAPGDRARVSARRARPVDRRHGDETLGPAHANHQYAAADHPAGGRQGRGRSDRRVSAAGAAGQFRPADPVRPRHHGAVRAPQHRGAAIFAAVAGERHVHLPRLRSRRSTIRKPT